MFFNIKNLPYLFMFQNLTIDAVHSLYVGVYLETKEEGRVGP